MEKPLVSVIIPNYNYAEFIGEAVDSVLNQTYPNIEIIVVDDGSKDNSREILESYGDKIKTIFQQNAGVSAARNNGVRESTGEFIAVLDADDIWLPEKIEKQIKKFSEDAELGMVHVGVDEFEGNGKILKTRLEGMDGWVSDELLLLRRPVVIGGGSGMLVPRKVFDEVGGFDLRLSTSADWDFCYQVASRYRIGFVPEVLLKYRMHSSNMHGNIARMEHEMLLGYEKAFSKNEENLTKIKRTAYGNLHQILAGSYFQAGNYSAFFKSSIKGIFFKPSNIIYFLKYPIRLLNRRQV